MNRKSKGSNAERELIHLFHKHEGWSAIRTAGSGSTKYAAPDILAGNAIRRIAIECKATSDGKKYIPVADIEQLQLFARRFGAEAWVGVRFPGKKWFFFMVEDLKKTEKSYVATLELADRKGLLFSDLLDVN